MPLSNLAKIFGPTITGYSTTEISPTAMLTETRKQQMIVEALMKIPSDYWNSFVKVDSETKLFTPQSRGLLSTPSTESLRTPASARDNHGVGVSRVSSRRKFFTGQNTPTNRWRGKKFFETPT
ncbi:hypothetical protein J437_LFUL007977 [Ladona fulva]|uniref:Rho-GAP domain-containing protein n=1 Tax=Ladona fulva TaxID=123851 RepID=A0A8K0P1U2_LADFU|nr:hypothetical protein J437_LFUL007977 [Ladona fulva]